MTPDDAELLRRYAEEGSQEAFAGLVRRHVGWLYAAALRQTGGDAHAAQEVTQMSFTTLARKARALQGHPAPAAWLYRAAAYAARGFRRSAARRSTHEAAAALETAAAASTAPLNWDEVRPVLDSAVHALRESDRRAIVLRFFANAPFNEVGRALGISEGAARMKVARALERLRERLARRGVTSTAAAIALALGDQVAAAVAPPAVVAGAIASGAAVPSVLAGSSAAALTLMTSVKLPLILATAAAVAGAGVWTVRQRQQALYRAETIRLAATAPLASQGPSAARVQADVASARRHDDSERRSLMSELKTVQAQAAALEAANRRKAAGPAVARPVGFIYDIAQLDVQPQPQVQAPPRYPFEMRRAGKGGTAVIDFVLDDSGKPRETHSVNATDPAFADAATAAVKAWRFKPGLKAGTPVYVHLQVPIVFSLQSEDDGTSAAPAPSPQDWFPTNS